MSIIFLRGCGDHKNDAIRNPAVDIGELIWYPFQFQECPVAFNDAIQPFYAFIVWPVGCILDVRDSVVDPNRQFSTWRILGHDDLGDLFGVSVVIVVARCPWFSGSTGGIAASASPSTRYSLPCGCRLISLAASIFT